MPCCPHTHTHTQSHTQSHTHNHTHTHTLTHTITHHNHTHNHTHTHTGVLQMRFKSSLTILRSLGNLLALVNTLQKAHGFPQCKVHRKALVYVISALRNAWDRLCRVLISKLRHGLDAHCNGIACFVLVRGSRRQLRLPAAGLARGIRQLVRGNSSVVI